VTSSWPSCIASAIPKRLLPSNPLTPVLTPAAQMCTSLALQDPYDQPGLYKAGAAPVICGWIAGSRNLSTSRDRRDGAEIFKEPEEPTPRLWCRPSEFPVVCSTSMMEKIDHPCYSEISGL